MANRYQRTPKVFNASFTPPKQKKQIDWSSYKSLLPLCLVLCLFIAIWLIGRLPVFSIKTIDIVGTDNQAVTAQLNDLKGKSIFSNQIGKTKKDILKNDYSIAEIDCKRGLPSYLKCTVSVREPSFIWRTNGQDYLADENSYLFGKTTATEGLIIVEDRSNVPVDIGSRVLNRTLAVIYLDVYRQLTAAGYAVSELYVTDTIYQLGAVIISNSNADINYPSGKTLEVRISISSPVNAQVASLGEIIKAKGAAISSYVDLRVPGYAYIK